MIQTVLHARVPAEKVDLLRAGYARLGSVSMPPGLVRTQLIRDTQDPDRWATRDGLGEPRGPRGDARPGHPGGVAAIP